MSSLVLGIESSCDEMAAAVVRDGREVLSSAVHGQHEVHRPYGGVVPELASRDHAGAVTQVVAAALREAGLSPESLSGVAATAGPGLVGSLLVGLSYGKAFAYRYGLPCVGVHHLVGHLMSAEIARDDWRPPYIGLVVSGGHTALYRIEAEAAPALLGQTRDDAVGEAFDKVAVVLGLGYPGGPAVSQAGEGRDGSAIVFPRPMARNPGLEFSYSGLKTAVAVEVEKRGGAAALDADTRAECAAGFEVAACESLVQRARRALVQEKLDRLTVVGGVAANRRLRLMMHEAGETDGFEVLFPPLSLCTDNAAMIAAAGARRLARGERDGLALNAFSRAPLEAWNPPPPAS